MLPNKESLTSEKVVDLVNIIQRAKDADVGKSFHGEPVNVLHLALMEVRTRGLLIESLRSWLRLSFPFRPPFQAITRAIFGAKCFA